MHAVSPMHFQMGGITCLIAAGSCHWRGFPFEGRRGSLVTKFPQLYHIQKNAMERFKAEAGAGKAELEEAGRQELEKN